MGEFDISKFVPVQWCPSYIALLYIVYVMHLRTWCISLHFIDHFLLTFMMVGNCQRRPRKRTIYGGGWVAFLGTRIECWCIYFFRLSSLWQRWRSLCPSSCLMSSMLSSKFSRSQQPSGMEGALCLMWCRDRWFRRRKRKLTRTHLKLSWMNPHL